MNNVTCKILQGGAAALAMALCGSTLANEQTREQQTRSQQTRAQSDATTRDATQRNATQRNASQRGSGQRQQTAQQQDDGRVPAIVIGELVETREVSINGKGKHKLLKLQPRGGKDNAIVVDVGAGNQSAISGLSKGDRVIAVGLPGRINDRPVIVAHSIGEFRATGVPGSSNASGRDSG